MNVSFKLQLKISLHMQQAGLQIKGPIWPQQSVSLLVYPKSFSRRLDSIQPSRHVSRCRRLFDRWIHPELGSMGALALAWLSVRGWSKQWVGVCGQLHLAKSRGPPSASASGALWTVPLTQTPLPHPPQHLPWEAS